MQSEVINSTPLRNCNNGEEDISCPFLSISVFDVISEINTYKLLSALEASEIVRSGSAKFKFLARYLYYDLKKANFCKNKKEV